MSDKSQGIREHIEAAKKTSRPEQLLGQSELGRRIVLHPAVAALVDAEVERAERTTPDDVVNEILWLALRSGNVSQHYKTGRPFSKCVKPASAER